MFKTWYFFVFIDGNDEHFKYETGLTKTQFHQLLREVPAIQTPDVVSSKEPVAILIYLMKIRSGMTDMSLGCKFSVSRKVIMRRLRLGRRLLTNGFISSNINFVRDRDNLILHSSVLSRYLLSPNNPDVVVQIWDATYLFVEKSQNYRHQKCTYNSYKKRNFVKIMMCVLSDGTIMGVHGLYTATENDAGIAKRLLESNDSTFRNIRLGDFIIFVLFFSSKKYRN